MQKIIKLSTKLQALRKNNRILKHNKQYQQLLNLFPVDLKLNLEVFPKHLSIHTIYCYDDLRLSFYFLPKNQTMPLHDHPDMFVLSYLVSGLMQANQYTKHKHSYLKQSQQVQPRQLLIIQDQTNNLHEFIGLKDTIFLDILFPDYSDGRQCTFYKQESSVENICELSKISSDCFQLREL